MLRRRPIGGAATLNMLVVLSTLFAATAPSAGGTRGPVPLPPPPDLSIRPGTHGSDTRCGACHSTTGWREVTFQHERTGFPLTGRHAEVACQSCHKDGNFGRALARACAACHRDVHAGRMGAACDRCHGTDGWKDASTGPEAHRRTAFPLTGRHAVVPCEECHGDRRDRTYARPTPRCIGCHELDYGPRASAAGVDHATAGFSEDCRGCHGFWRFSPATFPAHDQCFQITRGRHAGIRCRGCHDATLPPMPVGGALSCTSDTANCLRCHSMPGIQVHHATVAGFQPFNRRCYECHRFAG
jgi:hypothetical protein